MTSFFQTPLRLSRRFWWYILPTFVVFIYLVWPGPGFPQPMDDFFWSIEPADRETPLRQAYYTNYFRGNVIFHYWDEMSKPVVLGVGLPTVRLSDYPPEDAAVLIRDQTRANYLEELVHPMRESLYVAALESRDPLTYHERSGKRYQNRIVVKYVPSGIWVRLAVGMAGLWLLLWLTEQGVKEVKLLVGR